MVSLENLFSDLRHGIHSADHRFVYEEDGSIHDTALGLKYCLYDSKPFAIYKDGAVILDGTQMTNDEAKILTEVKAFLPELNRVRLFKLWEEHKLGVNQPEPRTTPEPTPDNGGYQP